MKIGRYTASLILIVVGTFLLADQLLNTNMLAYLFDWWPLVLIGLGAEYLILSARGRRESKPLRLDVGGVFFALLISLVVVVVTQSPSQTIPFLKNLNLNFDSIGDFASSIGEGGHKFEKDVIRIPLAEGTTGVTLDNPNGSVEMKPGRVEAIEIRATVYVDRVDEARARGIAERSTLEYAEGAVLSIAAKGEEYEVGMRTFRPRMNLEIVVPESKRADYTITLQNGRIEAESMPLRSEFRASTSNGSIELRSLEGSVDAETTNGKITADSIAGSVHLRTTNGSIRVEEIGGETILRTTNGEVVAKEIAGAVQVSTSNGRISIDEAEGAVHAVTTNSSIAASSDAMGGDWELNTTNGRIEVALPENPGFTVDGSSGHGSISNRFPGLIVGENRVEGRVGAGTYRLKLDTNGSISLRSSD